MGLKKMTPLFRGAYVTWWMHVAEKYSTVEDDHNIFCLARASTASGRPPPRLGTNAPG